MSAISEIPAEFSFEKEKAIAKTFSQRFQWEMILIGLGQAAIWFSLWPLVLNGFIDLWIGFFIASLCACFAFALGVAALALFVHSAFYHMTV